MGDFLKNKYYEYNKTYLKILGTDTNGKIIKIVQMKCVRISGYEQAQYHLNYSTGELIENKKKSNLKNSTCNSSKLIESISRTKSLIFEYAFCNDWDYFFTGTLDSSKYVRNDLERYHKDLTQWIRNYKRKTGQKIDFLLIPELHKDGKSWHMHGFIKGVPVENLHQFKIGDKMGKNIAKKVKNGDVVYNWLDYANKFGFCDLEPIKSADGVSKYVTKYITKDLANCVTQLNAHMFYHSRPLNRAKTVKSGTMYGNIIPDFENEYCRILTCAYSDDVYNRFLSKFN